MSRNWTTYKFNKSHRLKFQNMFLISKNPEENAERVKLILIMPEITVTWTCSDVYINSFLNIVNSAFVVSIPKKQTGYPDCKISYS